jgi:hypothetical protein
MCWDEQAGMLFVPPAILKPVESEPDVMEVDPRSTGVLVVVVVVPKRPDSSNYKNLEGWGWRVHKCTSHEPKEINVFFSKVIFVTGHGYMVLV